MVTARRIWRTLSFVCAGVWAWVLTVVGFLAIADWPERLLVGERLLVPLGVVLIALGQFVFAFLVADRVFPRASTRVAGSFELAAWICVLLAPILGGLL